MITFGGSDTYFMTNKILGKLNKSKYISAYYGPGYKNKISSKMNKNINHIQNINNLENEMIKYDLLICGGGILQSMLPPKVYHSDSSMRKT